MVPDRLPTRRAVLTSAAGGLGALAGCGNGLGGEPSKGTDPTPPTDGGTPSLASRYLDASALSALEPEPPYADPSAIREAPGDCPTV